MQFDEVRVRRALHRAVAFVEAVHESEFAEPDGFAAAVKHDIEARRFLRVVTGGDHEAERLHGAVHRRDVTANELPLSLSPRRLACRECLNPFQPARQRLLDEGNISGFEFGLVLQRPDHAFVEHGGVRNIVVLFRHGAKPLGEQFKIAGDLLRVGG
jgi:hypothetical protein